MEQAMSYNFITTSGNKVKMTRVAGNVFDVEWSKDSSEEDRKELDAALAILENSSVLSMTEEDTDRRQELLDRLQKLNGFTEAN